MQKNNNPLKTKRIQNIKMSAKGVSVFIFSLPRGWARPPAARQSRHCSRLT